MWFEREGQLNRLNIYILNSYWLLVITCYYMSMLFLCIDRPRNPGRLDEKVGQTLVT